MTDKKKKGIPEARQLDSVDKQNQARVELNLPLLKVVERKCLQCDSLFISASYRRCAQCRKDNPN